MTKFFLGYVLGVFILAGNVQADNPPLLKKSSQSIEKKSSVSPLPEVALGMKQAPLKVVMYHALNCLHCKEFKEGKLPALKAKYIDTGKIYFIFLDFPIDRDSMAAAKLAWCQRNPQNYMKIEEIMTKNVKGNESETVQVDWTNASDPTKALVELMGHHGMNQQFCQSCLARTDVEDAILQNALEAQQKYKLDYAPGFLINGQMVDMSALEGLIEKELSKIKK